MSDLMLTAVLSMPYDMAMADDLSRRQFYDRAQQALEVIERLRAERDEARAERDAMAKAAERMRAALNTIARTPAMPFPDPGAHSARAYHEAVFMAWSRSNQTARAALAQIEQEKANGSR